MLLLFPLWAGSVDPGDRAPKWRMKDVSGGALRFPRDIGDKTSVVLFWASWCPYCKALMPRLAGIQAELGREELPVLALQLELPEDARGASIPDGFRVFEDAWDAAEDYGVSVLPGLFVVSDGRILYRLDYPPEDHPSQQLDHGAEQAALLGRWWEQRLRGILQAPGKGAEPGRAAR